MIPFNTPSTPSPAVRRYPLVLLGCLLAATLFYIVARAHGAQTHTVQADDSLNAGRVKINSNFAAQATSLSNLTTRFSGMLSTNYSTNASSSWTNILFSVPVPDGRGAHLRVQAMCGDEGTLSLSAFDFSAAYYSDDGNLTPLGSTVLTVNVTNGVDYRLDFFGSATNLLVRGRAVSSQNQRWSARLEYVITPAP